MQVCVWDMFVNVDGQFGCIFCFLLYVMFDNFIVDCVIVKCWDVVLCYDWYEQIKYNFIIEEQGLFVLLLLYILGGNMYNLGLWDMIWLYVLLMYNSDNFVDVWF